MKSVYGPVALTTHFVRIVNVLSNRIYTQLVKKNNLYFDIDQNILHHE